MKGVTLTSAVASRRHHRKLKIGSGIAVALFAFAVILYDIANDEPSQVQYTGFVCYCPCDDCVGYDIVAEKELTVEELKSLDYEEYGPEWNPESRRMH